MTTLMPATLTAIPGIDDNDLTQVQIRNVPTAHDQTVEYWTACLGETRSCVMDNMEDPIVIHAVMVAHLTGGDKANLTLLQQIAWTGYAAKETLEVLKSSGTFVKGNGYSDDYALFDIDARLALFENLPEVGREHALTGINTPEFDFPTCLEETSFYWNCELVDPEEALAAKERATNPKVIRAIGAAL